MAAIVVPNWSSSDSKFAAVDTGIISISNSAYTLAFSYVSGQNDVLESAMLNGAVVGAAGALTHWKMTWAATVGGTHDSFMIDTDFNSPNLLLPFASSNIYTTAAATTPGTRFKQIMENMRAAEVNLYAQASTTGITLQITGNVGRR